MKIKKTIFMFGKFVPYTGLFILIFSTLLKSNEKTSENDEKLKKMLNKYPQADTNNDGILTQEEARKARKSYMDKKNKKKKKGRRKLKIPEGYTMKTIVYREGEFKRAWQMNLVYETDNKELRPGIVFVHGGGWKSGDKDKFAHYAIKYAQKGYITISPAYRLLHEAPISVSIEDVKNAVRWFRAHAKEYYLDPDRIGAYGNSAGAHLVSMLGLTRPKDNLEGDGTFLDHSSKVQAVTASATPSDFSLFKKKKTKSRSPDSTDKERAERNKKISPISYVHKDAPPFLLIHGTADKTVNIKHGDSLVEALKKAGAKDITYIRVPDAGHGVFGQEKEKTWPAMEEFFERTLKKKK